MANREFFDKKECVEEKGKVLDINNQDIVKYMCSLQDERNNLSIIIEKQYLERKNIESEIEKLTYKLCLINKSLAQRIKAKSNYDKTIEEIETNYEQLVEGSSVLKKILEKQQTQLDDLMNKKTGTEDSETTDAVKTIYARSPPMAGTTTSDPNDDCDCPKNVASSALATSSSIQTAKIKRSNQISQEQPTRDHGWDLRHEFLISQLSVPTTVTPSITRDERRGPEKEYLKSEPSMASTVTPSNTKDERRKSEKDNLMSEQSVVTTRVSSIIKNERRGSDKDYLRSEQSVTAGVPSIIKNERRRSDKDYLKSESSVHTTGTPSATKNDENEFLRSEASVPTTAISSIDAYTRTNGSNISSTKKGRKRSSEGSKGSLGTKTADSIIKNLKVKISTESEVGDNKETTQQDNVVSDIPISDYSTLSEGGIAKSELYAEPPQLRPESEAKLRESYFRAKMGIMEYNPKQYIGVGEIKSENLDTLNEINTRSVETVRHNSKAQIEEEKRKKRKQYIQQKMSDALGALGYTENRVSYSPKPHNNHEYKDDKVQNPENKDDKVKNQENKDDKVQNLENKNGTDGKSKD